MVFSWTRVAEGLALEASYGEVGQRFTTYPWDFSVHTTTFDDFFCEWITKYWMIVNVDDKKNEWITMNIMNRKSSVQFIMKYLMTIISQDWAWRKPKDKPFANSGCMKSRILRKFCDMKWPLLMVGFRILSWHGLKNHHWRFCIPCLDQDWFSIQKLSF